VSGAQLRIQLERGSFFLDVSASWEERVAVVFGPSGSGKTTLFEVLLGLHRAELARVELAGTLLEDTASGLRMAVEQRRLGWVPQEASLLPHLNVRGNLRLGLGRAGAEGQRQLERAIEVLEIESLLDRSVKELSGGERQRVALGRALASSPRALLLDEPLASLDLALRARVLPFLRRIRDELDVPLLYITHDPDEAILLGDVVVVLDAGRVVAIGSPREVLWSRAVLPLSESLGIENVVEAHGVAGEEGVVETRAGLRLVVSGPVEPGETRCLGLRAEDLLLAAERPGRLSARNILPARITALEERGSDVLVRLHAGEPLVAKVTRGAARALSLAEGRQIHVIVKAQAIRRLA
jgi:molybdate transport system ATP-binding protein